jgi:diguanylate cyclase
VGDVMVAGSNSPQNSPVEIIGLIDQFLECVEQMKKLSLGRQECEQSRYEQISEKVALIHNRLEKAKMQVALDALTQVADLESFNCTVRHWIAAHSMSGAPFTIAYFNLDNCRQINEIFGRPAGDKVLAFLALELGKNIRERDYLARCSGDRFAVLSSGMELKNAAKRFSKLLQQFETFQFGTGGAGVILCTVSCGIAEFACGENVEELTERAENALCDAKKLDKNRVATRLKFLFRDDFSPHLQRCNAT